LFVFTLKDVTARVRAEEGIVDSITRMRALSGRVVALQEEERLAVARELHDEIGQGLTAVKIHLQAMALACKGCEMAFSTENLDEALLTVAKILEQVRGLSLNLRPMQLDDLGLTVALSSLVARDAGTAGWIAHFDEDLSTERLDSNLELACYRVAQEALTNVMRHAGASEVWITLRRSDQALLLTVRDNGRGFDLASARSAIGTPHLGLLGMEERVRNIAGQFEIRTRREEGTEVRASFPIVTAVAGTAALA
jgi:two-component system sensor histidine kinase UhpB